MKVPLRRTSSTCHLIRQAQTYFRAGHRHRRRILYHYCGPNYFMRLSRDLKTKITLTICSDELEKYHQEETTKSHLFPDDRCRCCRALAKNPGIWTSTHFYGTHFALPLPPYLRKVAGTARPKYMERFVNQSPTVRAFYITNSCILLFFCGFHISNR